jgi:hypothetical protein
MTESDTKVGVVVAAGLDEGNAVAVTMDTDRTMQPRDREGSSCDRQALPQKETEEQTEHIHGAGSLHGRVGIIP